MGKKVQNVISLISKEIEKVKKGVSQSRRYSKEVKSSVLELLDNGISRHDISKSSGLSMTTLANWQKAHGSPNTEEESFKEISVVEEVPHNLLIGDVPYL